MKNNKNNAELQSRRQFFKKAAKATLPILAVAVLGPTLLTSCDPDDPDEGNNYGSSSSCKNGCSGTCSNSCSGGCSSGCSGSCDSGCEGSCGDSCSANCHWQCTRWQK